MDRKLAAALLAVTLGLAGCGSTDLERGATGAAFGAIGATVLGGNAVTGAALGAGAGVLCDDLTPTICR